MTTTTEHNTFASGRRFVAACLAFALAAGVVVAERTVMAERGCALRLDWSN